MIYTERTTSDDPASASLKSRLFHAFLNAKLRREPARMPRIAHA